MRFFSSSQIRQWDAFTIKQEPVSSILLMERAAQAAVRWVLHHYHHHTPLCFFCGPGNNGGDGLAMARQLFHHGYAMEVFLLPADKHSADYRINLDRLRELPVAVTTLNTEGELSGIASNALIIDCLYGTGLSRPLERNAAHCVAALNKIPNPKLSIDLPSGLLADAPTPGDAVIHASHTLSFQCPKLAFFMPESEDRVGKWEVLDIGLHPDFRPDKSPAYYWVHHLAEYVNPPAWPRFAHKGNRGHALLVAGSAPMMGAAILATHACVHSGAGLVTLATEPTSWPLIQQAVPPAMCCTKSAVANEDFLKEKRIRAIGIGPGLIPSADNVDHLAACLLSPYPLVIDASALAMLPAMQHLLPARNAATIITPHVGEFDRLVGDHPDHFQRLASALEWAASRQTIVVLKGAYTRVILPDGKIFFNNTGNPGMAKGGSGDVLTGLLTGLLAQGMEAADAAVAGVYLHGLAGDRAAAHNTRQFMSAANIIDELAAAYRLQNWGTEI